MVAQTYNYMGFASEDGRIWSKASLGKSVRPYLKNKLKQKGLGAQLKKALSSNPSTDKKKKTLEAQLNQLC
jgi:hypothetical protein